MSNASLRNKCYIQTEQNRTSRINNCSISIPNIIARIDTKLFSVQGQKNFCDTFSFPTTYIVPIYRTKHDSILVFNAIY